jgi:hypothetical protein
VSRREWRCRNPHCPVPHGAVLGRVVSDEDSVVLPPGVAIAAVFFDTGRVEVTCPARGAVRNSRGRSVRYTGRSRADR